LEIFKLTEHEKGLQVLANETKLKSDEIMEVWSYDIREKDFDSFVKILGSKIFNNDEIVFIEVSHELIGSEFIDVDFMPFSKDLLMGSLIEKVNEEEQNTFLLNKKIAVSADLQSVKISLNEERTFSPFTVQLML
jgi:hypothetical protein